MGTGHEGDVQASVIGKYLESLRQSQFAPPRALLAHQRELLEPLLRHARAHVPFYRDSGRLDPLFRGDGAIAWERWGEIPMLSRAELQRAGQALRAELLPGTHGTTFTLSTSGSTGEPVSVVHTQLSRSIAWIAILLRDYERHGIDPSRRLAHLAPPGAATTDIAEIRRHDAWYPELAAIGLHGERFDVADTRPVRELIDVVVSLRPDYLRVQPIALALMCAHDAEGRLGRLGIRAITTVGEQLSREARARAEAHFGCGILDHYGSAECGRMASSCPYCGRYHVHGEVALLEVVDRDGAAAAPGESGRIVVTPLYNYAMPLIRYDHADQARVSASNDCRIALPALEEISGKERSAFVFPGGIAIRPTLPTEAVVEMLGAQAYQVAQTAEDRCEFRFVAGGMARRDMQFDRMTALMRAQWWHGLKVDYRIVDRLPRPLPYQKIPLFVCELSAGDMR